MISGGRRGLGINPREMLVGMDKAWALVGCGSECPRSDLMGFQVLRAARRHGWTISGQGSWLLRAADLRF